MPHCQDDHGSPKAVDTASRLAVTARDLDNLVRSNAITEHQRDLLISNTEPLEDLWANPYLRSVREHSRAYIEHLMFGGFGAAPRPSSDRGI